MLYKNTKEELAQLTEHCKNDETILFLEELEKLIGFDEVLQIGEFSYHPCKKQNWRHRINYHFHGNWYLIPNGNRLLLTNVLTEVSLTVAVYVFSTNYSGWEYYYDQERTEESELVITSGLNQALKALEV